MARKPKPEPPKQLRPRKARPGEKIIDTVEMGLMLSDNLDSARQLTRYHLNQPGHLQEIIAPCDGCKKRFVTMESALALQESLRDRREKRAEMLRKKRERAGLEDVPPADADGDAGDECECDDDEPEWEAEEDVDELAAFAESEEE